MTENSPYRRTILFWLYIVPLNLRNVFCVLAASTQITVLLGTTQHVFFSFFL